MIHRLRFSVLVVAAFLATLLWSQECRFAILHSSDLHGQVRDSSHGSSWLRLSSAVKQVRADEGSKNCLHIDTGDTIQGSLFAQMDDGKHALALLQAMKADLWVLGNHDLDYGGEQLQQLLRDCKVPYLAGNLKLFNKPVPAYRVFKRNGCRVAVIGMTSPYLTHWLWGARYRGVEVSPALKVLERVMPEVQREKPHVIVLAMHQGYIPGKKTLPGEAYEIAARFPQIHLMLGGHTHMSVPGKRILNVHFMQPGAHGQHLGKAVIHVDLAGRKPIRIDSELIDTSRFGEDLALKCSSQAAFDAWRKLGSRVIARSGHKITPQGIPGKDNQISALFARAMLWRSKAEVALHGTLSGKTIYPGPVRERDLFAVVPFENTMAVVEVTREELTTILDEQLRHIGTYRMNGLHGIRYSVDWKTKRVRSIDFDDRRSLRLVLNSYVAAGGGARYPSLRRIIMAKRDRCVELKQTTREILRDYLETVEDWSSPAPSWTD